MAVTSLKKNKTSNSDKAEPCTVLYIGGAGQLGPATVELLLNQIKGVHGIGETVNLCQLGLVDGVDCTCGKPFKKCEWWSEVGEIAFNGWDNIDTDRFIHLGRREDRTRKLPKIIRAHHSGHVDRLQADYLNVFTGIFAAARSLHADTKVLVDSSRRLPTGALIGLDPDVNVRVLHIVETPQDVVRSTAANSNPDFSMAEISNMSAFRTSWRWVRDHIGFEILARTLPTLRIRYSDLVDDPQTELMKIVAHMGLSTDEDLSFVEEDSFAATSKYHAIRRHRVEPDSSKRVSLHQEISTPPALSVPVRIAISAITGPLSTFYRQRFR